MPRVNHNVLKWARETAGFGLDEAAAKLAFRDSKRQKAVDKLAALESGDVEPTRAQLVRMSRNYRRPLLLFYLDRVPQKGDRGQDFRTLPTGYSISDDARVDAIVRDVRARQYVLKSALEAEDEDREPLAFIAARSRNDGVAAMVAYLRNLVGFTLEDFRGRADIDEAFAMARTRVEALGVFVILMGDLGSHHSAVEVEIFRGFALADPVAPFIVINDRDAREAWAFTLIHELAHLCLGLTGISAQRGEDAVEQFCNDVASEFLLPAQELARLAGVQVRRLDVNGLRVLVENIAGPRLLSRSLVLYRLYRAELMSLERWGDVAQALRGEWLENRERRRERGKEREGGPNYYVVRRHRLGIALISTVNRLLFANALTTTKAALVLAVKPANVGPLVSRGDKSSLVA